MSSSSSSAMRRTSDSHCPAGNWANISAEEPGRGCRRAVWDRRDGKSRGMPAKQTSQRMPSKQVLSRLLGLWCWAYLVWVLLTWTLTVEQLLFGVVIALVVAVALGPLGEVAGPWRLLRPRALTGGAWLLTAAAWRVLLANIQLARRIWDPRRPL